VDKILVGLKRVVDYNVRVRVKSDGSGVETDGVKMSINPFDENALEEALRIKESGGASEVIVVSIGPSEAQQQLRTGLAMGADRAILITWYGHPWQTGHRRRQLPDRPDACSNLGQAAGHVRVSGNPR
jgi:electron transfer flavoprotein alpha/beta subunit